jgi:hypothetical protein
MADNDETKQDTPSTTDEAADEADVEGHGAHYNGLRPEIDAAAPRSTEEGRPDPVESNH